MEFQGRISVLMVEDVMICLKKGGFSFFFLSKINLKGIYKNRVSISLSFPISSIAENYEVIEIEKGTGRARIGSGARVEKRDRAGEKWRP